jgi:hypothetical protein
MSRLTLLLLSLWLSDALAQTAPAAPTPPAATNPNTQSQTAIPGARPAPNTAASATGKAVTAAPAAAATAPAAPAPKAEPPAPEPPKVEPAAAPEPPKPAKKGKEPEPPPPPKPQGPLKAPSCAVADFRAIGVDSTDEQARRAKASAWLKKKGPNCSAEQLIVIRNNRSQWLGNADSATVAALVDGLLESFAETNPAVSILLYGTPPPPPKPDDKKTAADAAKK